MLSADCLWLDAKRAVLDEQFRRWRELTQAARRDEAANQCRATLACAADLLNESLQILDSLLQATQATRNSPPPTAKPS